MYCLKCNKILKGYQKIFCSRSCAASFNNTGRINSDETKVKRSKKLKEFYRNNPVSIKIRKQTAEKCKLTCSKREHKKLKNCTFCGKEFISTRSIKNNYYPVICSNECLLNSKRKCARGNKNIIYKGIHFDSTWELELAEYLDNKNILWVQPKNPILWCDNNGKQRKYFPDFYLPQYNLYLDPKNPIVIKQQQEKLNAVIKLIPLTYGHINDIKKYVDSLTIF